MRIVRSKTRRSTRPSPKLQKLLREISEKELRKWVNRISVPRHYIAERAQNRATAEWLVNEFQSFGFRVKRQGRFSNVVAVPKGAVSEAVLVGAHYDSVPGCPGADDNGSAMAAMLGCAAACSLWSTPLPVVFVSFNCEEDGLVGSRDFVESFLPSALFRVRCAHILEMVGYASAKPESQRTPGGLPIKISDRGDFLGLLTNRHSNAFMDKVLRTAETYTPELPVIGLKVRLGLEKYLPVLERSDHAPFWDRGISAVMWTDTAEFRNPNYHLSSDTPETLDYRFLQSVTRLLAASVIEEAAI